jgi:hypothetical protein
MWCLVARWRWRRAQGASRVFGAALWWRMSGWLSRLSDLSDDAVAGYLFRGYVFSAWMGWPWWTLDERALRVAYACARRPERDGAGADVGGCALWWLCGSRRRVADSGGGVSDI